MTRSSTFVDHHNREDAKQIRPVAGEATHWQYLLSVVGTVIVLGAACGLVLRMRPRPDRIYIQFIKEHHIDDQTLIVSDYPGEIAFRTRNRVIASDMLTSNRRFYKRMIGASDAVAFLFDEAMNAGKPVQGVLFIGNRWLVPSEDLRSVTYNDPRRFPVEVAIGRMILGEPTFVRREGATVTLVYWSQGLANP